MISPRPAGPGGSPSITRLSRCVASSTWAYRSECRSHRALSSSFAWSVIWCRRASTTFWKTSGCRSKTANSSRPRAMAQAALTDIVCAPAIPGRQAGRDPVGQLSHVTPAELVPGLLALQQFPQVSDLVTAELDRGASSCLYQTAQVIGLSEPLEPAHSRSRELVCRQVHGQGDERGTDRTGYQPRDECSACILGR